MNKSRRDLVASRNVIDANVEQFHRGYRDVYRPIATELRKLFCDRSTRPLVPRLFPTARLHPTRLYQPGEDLTHLAYQMPFEMESTENGLVITEIFQRNRTPLPVTQWLDQPLLNASATLREVILSVADKEGAHSDPGYNDTLRLLRGMRLGGGEELRGEELIGPFIVAIGEYVLSVLDMAISSNPKGFPVKSRLARKGEGSDKG